MKKIESLFDKKYENDRHVREHVAPQNMWVLEGEGFATFQWDGVCCLVKDGKLYRLWVKDVRRSRRTSAPSRDAIRYDDEVWEPINLSSSRDSYFAEAWNEKVDYNGDKFVELKTYELVGPKVNGNPHNLSYHHLAAHHGTKINVPRDFDLLRAHLRHFDGKGIVFHHPDGRMARVRRTDFYEGQRMLSFS